MRERIIVGILLLLITLRCFSGITTRPMELWDEANNATVAWELVDTESFPYLTLHKKPFLEKPPLWYYLTAIVVSFFGPTQAAFRLVSVLSGITLIFLIYIVSRAWYGRIAGFTAVGLLLSTEHLFQNNPGGFFSTHTIRSADGDVLHILLLFLSVVFYRQYTLGKPQWIYAGAIASALAFLTKGPLALVPGILFVLYLWIHRKNKPIHGNHIIKATLLFLIIVAPWYITMFVNFGTEFLSQHIGYHLIRRIGEPLEGHMEPVWYYVTLLADKRVFWGFELLILSFLFLLQRDNRLSYTVYMPVCMTFTIICIATLSKTKLAWYILPLYPFAALVIGNTVQQIVKSTQKKKKHTSLRR